MSSSMKNRSLLGTSIPTEFAWLIKYEQLKDFKCRKGHCNVPYGFNENKSLGEWVKTQRRQYKYMREGRPSSMTESRIRTLEDIGFEWSRQKRKRCLNTTAPIEVLKKRLIKTNYNDACQKKSISSIPSHQSQKTTSTLTLQKQQPQQQIAQSASSRCLKQKEKAYLQSLLYLSTTNTNESINITEKLNDPKELAWFIKYEQLKDFKCREGHCNVPYRFSENKSLGEWVKTQRAQYKYMRKGKPTYITESRVRALEGIGFKWSMKDQSHSSCSKKYDELKQSRCHEEHYIAPSRFSKSKSLRLWDRAQSNIKI